LTAAGLALAVVVPVVAAVVPVVAAVEELEPLLSSLPHAAKASDARRAIRTSERTWVRP
jgi:hypothetical protein